MNDKKGKQQDPIDEDRGVEDILGGLLGANAAGMPQGGGAPAGGSGALSGSSDLMDMLGGLLDDGAQGGAGGGSADLMSMLGGLLGGGPSGNSSVSANAPSILSALLPLVLGVLGGGGTRSAQVDVDQRASNELHGMFGAAQSGELDMNQVRSSGVVHDVAAQTGTSQEEVADTLNQLMQMLGGQR